MVSACDLNKYEQIRIFPLFWCNKSRNLSELSLELEFSFKKSLLCAVSEGKFVIMASDLSLISDVIKICSDQLLKQIVHEQNFVQKKLFCPPIEITVNELV